MILRSLCLGRLRRRQREKSGRAGHAAEELAATLPAGLEDLYRELQPDRDHLDH